MFGKVISPVGCTRAPENVKLPLMFAIMKPIKEHAHHFGLFLFDGVIGNLLALLLSV